MSISVVIPVYNSKKFLKKCLDSVISAVNPSCDEVIIVYDESHDGSLSLISDYVDRYSFLVVLDGEGKGCGAARNIGLRFASKEYIAFVDSDDRICDGFSFKDTYENFDVICFDYIFENNLNILKKCHSSNLLANGKSAFYNFAMTGSFATVVWDKIYRREFLIQNGLFFVDLPEWEDVVFSAMVASVLELEKIGVCNALYYRAFVRTDSRSRYVTADFLEKATVALRIAYEAFDSDDLEKVRLFKYYTIRHLNYFSLKYLSRSNGAEYPISSPFDVDAFEVLFSSALPLHHRFIYILRRSRFGFLILKFLSFSYARRVSI